MGCACCCGVDTACIDCAHVQSSCTVEVGGLTIECGVLCNWSCGVRSASVRNLKVRLVRCTVLTSVVCVCVLSTPIPHWGVAHVTNSQTEHVPAATCTVAVNCILYVCFTIRIHCNRTVASSAGTVVVTRVTKCGRTGGRCRVNRILMDISPIRVCVACRINHCAALCTTTLHHCNLKVAGTGSVTSYVVLEIDASHCCTAWHCVRQVESVNCCSLIRRVSRRASTGICCITATITGVGDG